jgi:4-amino-4-deoxychorismate lyase
LRSLAEKMGLQWEEGPLRLEQLHQADEVFLTNALRGVQPVACFEGTTYSMETVSSLHLHWVEWQNTHALQVVT